MSTKTVISKSFREAIVKVSGLGPVTIPLELLACDNEGTENPLVTIIGITNTGANGSHLKIIRNNEIISSIQSQSTYQMDFIGQGIPFETPSSHPYDINITNASSDFWIRFRKISGYILGGTTIVPEEPDVPLGFYLLTEDNKGLTQEIGDFIELDNDFFLITENNKVLSQQNEYPIELENSFNLVTENNRILTQQNEYPIELEPIVFRLITENKGILLQENTRALNLG